MRLFGRRAIKPIQVSLNVRAFLASDMVRLTLDAEVNEGDRLKDLLKKLRCDGTMPPALVRSILARHSGVTVLQNGRRLDMPEAARTPLADGDQLSILTPMAGG